MRIIDTKPIAMPEAKEVMSKREKEKELNYEQKVALDHLKTFTKLKESDAKKMIEELSKTLRMSPETVAQIINIMPKTPDEVRLVFAREKFSLKEEELKSILEVVKKYS
jgi:DNA-directed RNA polymerase subunit F